MFRFLSMALVLMKLVQCRVSGPVLSKTAQSQPQLSRQTREWWRWVLVRIYDSSVQISDSNFTARQEFVDKWRPDLFDWGGDQRWNVQEWARLNGISIAAAGGIEYEEAQFHNHKYVNQTWGIEGGLALSRNGNVAGFASGGLSPYMTHAAPKWHTTVVGGHIRNARAGVSESFAQDNCDVMSFGHGGPDMGWGPWEERLFANSSYALHLGLPVNFSIRAWAAAGPGTTPASETKYAKTAKAFAEFTYLLWRDAWRDLAESSRHAATAAGWPERAVYGNSANAAISIIESAWQSLKWIEIGWTGPGALPLKLAQAQLRGGGNYTGIWRVAGLRAGQADSHGVRGVLAYLAEALSNDANEELLEGLKGQSTGPEGFGSWAHVPQCLASAQLVSTHRAVFIDRTRIADGAIVYCLSCVLWRQTGFLSVGTDQHANAVVVTAGLLEEHQVLHEVALLGHPRFFDRPDGLARLRPPAEGGYRWIILPLVDAMSDSDIALVTAYVRGGGRAVIVDGAFGGAYSTGTRTEDMEARCDTSGCGLADLKRNPGAGTVVVLNTTSTAHPWLGPDPWPTISSVIDPSTAEVSVTGLTKAQSFNAWLHGQGPMVSVHVVNFNFSSRVNSMPPFHVTVATPDLATAEKPVAWLYSIDFANETTGRPLPITRSTDGRGWRVDVLPQLPQHCNTTIDHPPKGQIRAQQGLFAGVSTAPTVEECSALCCKTGGCLTWALDVPWLSTAWSGCVNGKPCCAMASGPVAGFRPYPSGIGLMNITSGVMAPRPAPADVHAIVVVASSAAELETRELAAEARMWLQKAVVATSSHGVRLLPAGSNASKQSAMPVLLAADQELGLVQGEGARTFIDDAGRVLRTKLNLSIEKLQDVMNATRLSVHTNEAGHRHDHLTLCAKPGSCLVAVNFAAAETGEGEEVEVEGYKGIAADAQYNDSVGLGFVNTGDTVRDARVAFHTDGPDDLHRSGVFNSYRSTFRVDVDLSADHDHDLDIDRDDGASLERESDADLPTSLLLTIVSGFDDLGSPSASEGMGVYGGQKVVPAAGMCGGHPCGGRETSAWMGIASTAVSVIVRSVSDPALANENDALAQEIPCMLGEVGRPNGYFLTRTCPIDVSAAVARSPKLQIDLILAPHNGLTGCFLGANCGKMSFAWLLNALVLQRPTTVLPPRARASLLAANQYASSAVRNWSWVGPFDDGHGNGMGDAYRIEQRMHKTWLPPSLSMSYVGKGGAAVTWRTYICKNESAAPHLPLSALLPTRQLNTGSVAFAMTRAYCKKTTGCATQITVAMSDRGRMWLLSANGSFEPQEIATDNLLHGLTVNEQEFKVTLPQGSSVLLVKSLNEFAADTIAINGSRAPGWGVVAPTVGLGILNGTNEWGVALSLKPLPISTWQPLSL
jgi:hypothetical protein